MLTLIRQFDEAEGWAEPGLRSCAHWLNWKCGIGLNAAREKIRVATPENEEFLLMIALHGTASHVERAVRQFRRVKRGESLETEKDRRARRRVVWRMDEDGSAWWKRFRGNVCPNGMGSGWKGPGGRGVVAGNRVLTLLGVVNCRKR